VRLMKAFDLSATFPPSTPAAAAGRGARAAVLLDEGQAKVRRLELEEGGVIPPCRMRDDVVFVVMQGSVMITCGAEEEVVAAPGAAYVPGGTATRSLRALEPSLLLAVVCKGVPATPSPSLRQTAPPAEPA
jgi:quercetin dioxygenase-like cupin family protein